MRLVAQSVLQNTADRLFGLTARSAAAHHFGRLSPEVQRHLLSFSSMTVLANIRLAAGSQHPLFEMAVRLFVHIARPSRAKTRLALRVALRTDRSCFSEA